MLTCSEMELLCRVTLEVEFGLDEHLLVDVGRGWHRVGDRHPGRGKDTGEPSESRSENQEDKA